MEEDSGRQKRVIKVKTSSEFSYDEDSLQFLKYSRATATSEQQQQSSVDRIYGEVSGHIYNTEGASGWSELNFLKYGSHLGLNNSDYNQRVFSLFDQCQSSSQQQYTSVAADAENICFDSDDADTQRKNSSTRCDFLDIYSIVSVSPTLRADSSDMTGEDSGTVSKCHCTIERVCQYCEPKLINKITQAMEKIDFLTNKVTSLETSLHKQGEILKQLEASSSEAEVSEVHIKSGSKNQGIPTVSKGKKGNSKAVRLE